MATITEGTYTARVTDATFARSKTKGTPYVGLQLEITEGDCKGQKLKWEGYLTDKTAERTLESLTYCGWTGDDVAAFTKGAVEGVKSNEVSLVVEMETYEGDDPKYQGKSFPRVIWINRKGGGAKLADAMDPVMASEFGKKFKGLAMAVRAKSASPGAQNGNTSASGTDDLPF